MVWCLVKRRDHSYFCQTDSSGAETRYALEQLLVIINLNSLCVATGEWCSVEEASGEIPL